MSTTTSTERPPETNRTPQETPAAPARVLVPRATVKLVLEQLGYTCEAANEYCWIMARPGCRTLQIPRLGATVGTDCLSSTIRKAGIGPEQFVTLCQLCLPAERVRTEAARESGGAA